MPEVGAIKPMIIRITVVLPEPFGPKKPKTSPFFTLKLTLFTAKNLSNFFVRFIISIAFSTVLLIVLLHRSIGIADF
ncbi:hypothetical protein SDC9_166209 [bioreactor metagenome]|uniref:Uncharacterized protein n=1 Tax=bioreactor metagenome TaxID=1076179 RepID=A0A645G3Y4_9ZZZZ